MNLFFYTSNLDRQRRRLIRLLQEMFPDAHFESFEDAAELRARFFYPKDDFSAAVIVVSDQKELSAFLPIRDLISTTKILIVLPDYKKTTLASAHQLRPKFISYFDRDPSELILVLMKMIRAWERNGSRADEQAGSARERNRRSRPG
jgi:hypothetical protein